MPDMLVKLLTLPDPAEACRKAAEAGVSIFRAIAPDQLQVVEWVKTHSSPAAAGECQVCFSHRPVSCFIAVQGKELVGYACYDATAANFFGPTHVLERLRGKGIGTALLLKSLWAQREAGYVYAIIGGVGPAPFYEKTVGAQLIPNSTPGIYRYFLGRKGD